LDGETGETVPWVSIQTDRRAWFTDEFGVFSFQGYQQDVHISFSSLDYFKLDTLIPAGQEVKIYLEPNVTLAVVTTTGKNDNPEAHTGREAGAFSLTNVRNNPVPGMTDNGLFNNIALFPGIMSAGEPVSDLLVWGSHPGTSLVTFDGIPLFNAAGVNQNIGRVNTDLIKEIKVSKGVSENQFMDLSGSSINIVSRDGEMDRLGANMLLSNRLLSGYVNVPVIKGKSVIQIAGRQTLFSPTAPEGKLAQAYSPTYAYQDLNIKMVTRLADNHQFSISALGSQDDYIGDLLGPDLENVRNEIGFQSEQLGVSAQYLGSYSYFKTQAWTYHTQYSETSINNAFSPEGESLNTLNRSNPITVYQAGIRLSSLRWKGFEIATTLSYDHAKSYTQEINGTVESLTEMDKYNGALNANYVYSDKFQISSNLKYAHVAELDSGFWMPDFSLNYRIGAGFRLMANYAIRNQFFSKITKIDKFKNFNRAWRVHTGDREQPIRSETISAALHYQKKDWVAQVEVYQRNIDNFQRIELNNLTPSGKPKRVIFDSETKGIDLLVQRVFGKHQIHFGSTISQVNEIFPKRRSPDSPPDPSIPKPTSRPTEEIEAPHDQQYELKAAYFFRSKNLEAGLVQFYGSGFDVLRGPYEDFKPYYRTDFSAQYFLPLSFMDSYVTFSVLNVFNQSNLTLYRTVYLPTGGRLNTLATPRTFSIGARLVF
jgi:hypothetical protein